jgi:hypothetical protein
MRINFPTAYVYLLWMDMKMIIVSMVTAKKAWNLANGIMDHKEFITQNALENECSRWIPLPTLFVKALDFYL